jgi:hypothetical protein
LDDERKVDGAHAARSRERVLRCRRERHARAIEARIAIRAPRRDDERKHTNRARAPRKFGQNLLGY